MINTLGYTKINELTEIRERTLNENELIIRYENIKIYFTF